jgi:hypothetical protein
MRILLRGERVIDRSREKLLEVERDGELVRSHWLRSQNVAVRLVRGLVF